MVERGCGMVAAMVGGASLLAARLSAGFATINALFLVQGVVLRFRLAGRVRGRGGSVFTILKCGERAIFFPIFIFDSAAGRCAVSKKRLIYGLITVLGKGCAWSAFWNATCFIPVNTAQLGYVHLAIRARMDL